MRPAWCLGFVVAVVSLMLGGCSGKSTAPVKGKVTLSDGTPVQGAILSFEDAANHFSASGTTGPDGMYELMTTEPGDGAPPGTYNVTVHQPSPADSSQPDPPRLFDKRYGNPSTSGLQFTVKPDEENVFDIALEKP